MPNYAHNVLRLDARHAEQPKVLLDEALDAVKGERSVFDFNRLVPMPEALEVPDGSATDDALALTDDERAAKMLSWPWVQEDGAQTIADVRALLRKRFLEMRNATFGKLKNPFDGFATLDEYAERVRSNIDKYGVPNWYEWRSGKWGTKWNAIRCTLHRLNDSEAKLRFDTAWAPPVPVIDELAAKFPRLRMTLAWSEEFEGEQDPFTWNGGRRLS